MSEAWLNFIIVIFVQFLLFVIHAYYEKKLSDVPRILRKSVLSGIVLGLLLDLIFGKFFGLFSYTLGFGAFFLILNAALLYGLFVANTLLMQRVRLAHFFIWTMVVAAVFEITNLFFHMWTWEFVLPPVEFLIFISAVNFGPAILIATVWHVFLGHRFSFINNLFKK
ncbi:MAG: hypothetical protein WC662_01050 [Candidatus Paceibacterota bacterium]|jgi:hypothetical protein